MKTARPVSGFALASPITTAAIQQSPRPNEKGAARPGSIRIARPHGAGREDAGVSGRGHRPAPPGA